MSSGSRINWLKRHWKKSLAVAGLFALWALVHIGVVGYGTHQLPLTTSYIGDEESPISGALHIAESRNPFSLRNQSSVYYGPIFSVIVVPAVALDYAWRTHLGQVHKAADYKQAVTLDWGPTLLLSRFASLIFGFLGLCVLWLLLNPPEFNHSGKRSIPVLGVLLLGFNYSYFIYSGFLRHWIYLTSLLIVQLYCLIKIKQTDQRKYWWLHLIASAVSFGISYVSLLYQVAWLPLLVGWWKQRDKSRLKRFAVYAIVLAVCVAALVAWDSSPYLRIWGLSTTDVYKVEPTALPSAIYYLKVLLTNQPFLSLSLVLTAVFLVIFRKRIVDQLSLILILPAIVHFLFFSMSVRAEPRYVLPIILCLLALVLYLQKGLARPYRYVVMGLLVLELTFNVFSDARMLYLTHAGPEEKNLISRLERPDLQGKKVLITWSRILGAVHTKQSMARYAQVCQKDSYSLFKYMTGSEFVYPETSALDVDYLCSGQTSGGMPEAAYDYTVTQQGDSVMSNYYEEDVFRLWTTDSTRLRYNLTDVKTGQTERI